MLGLYILAQGISLTVLANLGTDAITSPALVAHLVLGNAPGGAGIEFCTVGHMLICLHVLLVLLQIVILRRQYQPVQLLQVLMGLILGFMVDACLSYTMLLPQPNYAASIGYTLLGCVCCSFGIFTYVKADMNSSFGRRSLPGSQSHFSMAFQPRESSGGLHHDCRCGGSFAYHAG